MLGSKPETKVKMVSAVCGLPVLALLPTPRLLWLSTLEVKSDIFGDIF